MFIDDLLKTLAALGAEKQDENDGQKERGRAKTTASTEEGAQGRSLTGFSLKW